jgi:class 3 adenylate cyclase
LFGDIRNIETHGHEDSAERTMTVLNRYFDAVVDRVAAHGGTVNKFIGDHLLVMFNVPLDMPDHASAAARSAFECLDWLRDHRKSFPEETVTFAFGINSGPLVAGNMGSKDRMEYTVIGDTVNTSSRLSGVAGKDEAIISQSTLDLMAGSGVKVEDRGEVMVKGKKEPIHIYCVLGFGQPGPVEIVHPLEGAVAVPAGAGH